MEYDEIINVLTSSGPKDCIIVFGRSSAFEEIEKEMTSTDVNVSCIRARKHVSVSDT
jgi:hypothetical protein